MTSGSAMGSAATTIGEPVPSRARYLLRRIASEHLIWLIFLLLAVVGSFVPGFLTLRNQLNLLWGAAPLGCMVVGMFFVMIAARLDLSIEGTFAFAPAVGIVAMTQWPNIDPLLALVVTLLIGAIVGLINGLIVIRLKVNAFLVTLATLLTLEGLVVFLIPEGVYHLPETYTALGGTRILGQWPVAVPVLLLLFVAAQVLMRRTAFGRSLVGIGNNEEACRIAGVDVNRIVIIAFVLAGFCAALGGILQVGRLNSVDSSMGNGVILYVFAGATLGGTALNGGRGSVSGLLGAVLVIGTITNLMNLYGVETSVQQIVFGLVLLGAILLSSIQDRLRAVQS